MSVFLFEIVKYMDIDELVVLVVLVVIVVFK